MKNIIVAIDFSKGSIHALDYAVSISGKIGAAICMVWVDNHNDMDSMVQENIHELRKESKDSMDELVKKYSKQYPKIKFTYKLRKGKVAQELAHTARIIDADLIMSGTHGGSGFEEYWIGSNANRIVMLAPCPVITVHNTFDISIGINSIVLPIDNSADTRKKVPAAIKFAGYFDAEILILGLYSTHLQSMHNRVDHYVEKVEEDLRKENISFKTEKLQTNNPTTTTINMVDEIHADLIVIMTEQDASAQNRLLGEYAVQMVNHSPVPVLSIHP